MTNSNNLLIPLSFSIIIKQIQDLIGFGSIFYHSLNFCKRNVLTGSVLLQKLYGR